MKKHPPTNYPRLLVIVIALCGLANRTAAQSPDQLLLTIKDTVSTLADLNVTVDISRTDGKAFSFPATVSFGSAADTQSLLTYLVEKHDGNDYKPFSCNWRVNRAMRWRDEENKVVTYLGLSVSGVLSEISCLVPGSYRIKVFYDARRKKAALAVREGSLQSEWRYFYLAKAVE